MALVDMEGLRALIESLLGVQTVLFGAPLPFGNDATQPTPDAYATINKSATSQLGEEDWRRTFDTGTQLLTVKQSGNRLFTLTVDIKSYSADADDLAEQLRNRLQRPGTRASLHALNCALVEVQPVTTPPYEEDNRAVQRAIVDVNLACVYNEVDPTDDGSWIEKVSGTGTDDLTGATFNVDGSTP